MTDAELTELFKTSKTIAVVGLSTSPQRPSFGVARFLQNQGYKVIPVNPQITEALGERAYPLVSAIPDDVDIVDIFRRPDAVLEVVQDALPKKPRCIWMQEGVEHQEAAELARGQGIPVVMNRCILKELARLLPRF